MPKIFPPTTVIDDPETAVIDAAERERIVKRI